MKRKCKYKGCNRDFWAKGYCSTHYSMLRKAKHPDVFGKRENEYEITYEIDDNGCFICTSHAANTKGYPIITRNGKAYTMGRFIYENLFGEVEEGLVIRHTCDNRICINPEHLITGTPKENSQDMVERERSSRGSRHPFSKLDEQKVYEIKLLLSEGKKTQKEIAKMYNVSRSSILHIKRGATWKHVSIS